MHKSLDEFKFRPDTNINSRVICPCAFEKLMYNDANTLAPLFLIGSSSYIYSSICGAYRVYFLLFKARGHSMKQNIFLAFVDFRDQFVYDFVKDTFDMCVSSQISCNMTQTCKPSVVEIN